MSRRLVTVLFFDLVGWTSLSERIDPEPLQVLLDRYYQVCSAAVAEHGGEIEKYIGDAVMAVFGAAVSREDDAMRALRAAFQIRAGLHQLYSPDARALEVHCGLAAGEALVTRSSMTGLRVVGDVVNLAARLQTSAAAGQILVNETLARLVRPHFTILPLTSLALKGKADPVPVLLAVGPSLPTEPAVGLPHMVDRTAERNWLHEAYERVVRDGRAQLVTVLGPLGIGKTRLVREAMAELAAGHARRPIVVTGTCPFYGPTENFTALVQVLEAIATENESSRRLRETNPRIAAVLASLGEDAPARSGSAEPGPGMEEIRWAARELLRAAAATAPVVVVWDNLGWAGRALLQLIGELTADLRQLPLLMVCTGRRQSEDPDPEAWIQGLSRQDVLEVPALTPADSAELAALLESASGSLEVQGHNFDLLDRVTTYSSGNPLFIELMLESVLPGQPVWDVPPTIMAVVGAMIDRVPAELQEVLGAAAVVGSTFTVDQLLLLELPTPDLLAALAALAEQQLLHTGPEDGEYRFAQQPVHEIAYARLDKERRLGWHRQLAAHQISPAFHLEAVVRLLDDLRPSDAERAAAARDAAYALLQDGTAALRQRDVLTATDMLGRAVEFAIDGQAGCLAVAAVRLSDALLLCGEAQRAMEVVDAGGWPAAAGQGRWACLVQRQLLAVRLTGRCESSVEALAAELTAAGADQLAWCRLEQLRMLIELDQGHYVEAERAAAAALEHARCLGDVYEEDRLLVAECEVRQWSPMPIADKLACCDELAERFALDRFCLIPVLAARARNLLLIGDRPAARAALAEAGSAVEQLQLSMGRVVVAQVCGLEHSLAGEHATAERHFRGAADLLQQGGSARAALTMRVLAVRECMRQHRLVEAGSEIALLLERQTEMDVRGRLLCTSTAARLAAAQGIVHPWLRAVPPLLAETDDPCVHGEIYLDLADAHRQLGDRANGSAMLAAAARSYATVGATEPVRRAVAWI
ncbi:MAG TPA: adenylate/guanylate cyclase domain-containing protein [Jatrophihabitans sp.]|nr:adenylate/guanylate cyclase domain-containing protein [Jatrophihabitans sp.]